MAFRRLSFCIADGLDSVVFLSPSPSPSFSLFFSSSLPSFPSPPDTVLDLVLSAVSEVLTDSSPVASLLPSRRPTSIDAFPPPPNLLAVFPVETSDFIRDARGEEETDLAGDDEKEIDGFVMPGVVVAGGLSSFFTGLAVKVKEPIGALVVVVVVVED